MVTVLVCLQQQHSQWWSYKLSQYYYARPWVQYIQNNPDATGSLCCLTGLCDWLLASGYIASSCTLLHYGGGYAGFSLGLVSNASTTSIQHSRTSRWSLSLGCLLGQLTHITLISSNVAGFTKKATCSAMVFIAYCVGNIVGPQFYFSSQAPAYPSGLTSSIVTSAAAAVLIIIYRIVAAWENKKRDRLYGMEEYYNYAAANDSYYCRTVFSTR